MKFYFLFNKTTLNSFDHLKLTMVATYKNVESNKCTKPCLHHGGFSPISPWPPHPLQWQNTATKQLHKYNKTAGQVLQNNQIEQHDEMLSNTSNNLTKFCRGSLIVTFISCIYLHKKGNHFFFLKLQVLKPTRRCGPLRGPSSSSCGGLRPSAEAFFCPSGKKSSFISVLVQILVVFGDQ